MDYFRYNSTVILHVGTLIFLCGLLYFPYLGHIPFFNKGEPREGLVVQGISTHGHWLFPLKSGVDIPSKPPLFHWFGALTSIVWGRVNEATIRFPSALFATLGVVVLYVLGRRVFDPETALLGGAILATSMVYQIQAIAARVDMTLAFFVALSLAIFYLLYQGFLRHGFWTYGFYLVLGVGVLAKGPIGLVLPAAVIGVFLALRKRWDFLYRLCFHKGAVLALVIGIFWYGLALTRGGEDFFNRQILHENLARFFVYGEGGTGHQKPFYYYLPYLFLQGLPWSIFLPFVVIDWTKRKPFSDDGPFFLILWVSVIFVLFSLSAGKRPVYLLPLYPALSLLIAKWLRTVRVRDAVTVSGLRLLGGFLLLICLVLGDVLFDVVWKGGTPRLFSLVSSMLKPNDRAGMVVVQNSLGRAGWIVLSLLGLWVFLSVLLAWDLFRFRLWQVSLNLLLLSLLTWTLSQSAFVPAIAEARSYAPFMREVNQRLVPGGRLYLYGGGIDSGPVFFYRGSPIPALKDDPAVLRESLESGPTYVIMREQEWRRIRAMDDAIPSPVLTSAGRGPEGDAPLVLVLGSNSGH